MPATYYVGWWNLENFFDEESSPRRTEPTASASPDGALPAQRG
jgi:hypothetical protein